MTNAISACALSAAVLTSTLTPAIPAASAIDIGNVRPWALGDIQPARSAALAKVGASAPLAPPTKANVVLVLLDDAAKSDVATMPNVGRLLTRAGTTFTRAYSPPALCCPARATILTGRYPHNTKIVGNAPPFGGYQLFRDGATIPAYITDDYRTGLFGKYLNGSASIGSRVPPGWDVFKMVRAQSELSFLSPTMSINGRTQTFPGREVTALYAKQTRDFITTSTALRKPFFAFLSFTAPHSAPEEHPVDYPGQPFNTTWVPERFRHTAPRQLPDDPSINEADVSDKPRWVRNSPLLTSKQLADDAERSAQRIEGLKAVDQEVANLVATLRRTKSLARTYIIFASDNGYMLGQHRRLMGKQAIYDPATRIPLIIRGPGFRPNTTYNGVVGLHDLAPTIMTMTRQQGDQRVVPMDGISLYNLATGARPTSSRVVQIELPRESVPVRWQWRGFVTASNWKFVSDRYTGEVELYNLTADPYELNNVATSRPGLVQILTRRLLHDWSCRGVSCRR